MVRAQNSGRYGAYSFKLNVPRYGLYPRHSAALDKYCYAPEFKDGNFGTETCQQR